MDRFFYIGLRLVPAILVMAMIFFFSAQTGSELQGMFPFLDSFDWGHFVAYFVLALAFYWGLKEFRIKYAYVLIVLLCLLYGVTDEFHQSFVPNRTPDVKDLINDTIGASLAMIVVSRFRKK